MGGGFSFEHHCTVRLMATNCCMIGFQAAEVPLDHGCVLASFQRILSVLLPLFEWWMGCFATDDSVCFGKMLWKWMTEERSFSWERNKNRLHSGPHTRCKMDFWILFCCCFYPCEESVLICTENPSHRILIRVKALCNVLHTQALLISCFLSLCWQTIH